MKDTTKALLAIIVINMAATCGVIVLFDVFKPPPVPLEAHQPAVPPEIERGPVNVIATNSYEDLVPPKDWRAAFGYYHDTTNEEHLVVLSSTLFTNWSLVGGNGYDSNRPVSIVVLKDGSKFTNRLNLVIRKAVVYRYTVLGLIAKDGTAVPLVHETISKGQITQTNGVDTFGPLEGFPRL